MWPPLITIGAQFNIALSDASCRNCITAPVMLAFTFFVSRLSVHILLAMFSLADTLLCESARRKIDANQQQKLQQQMEQEEFSHAGVERTHTPRRPPGVSASGWNCGDIEEELYALIS